MAVARTDALRLSDHPVLRVVLAAEAVSILGTQLSAVATPWLVLTLTGSARTVGLVTAAQFAAVTVSGLFGASWVTRLGPRRVMLYGDALCAVLIALLPALHALGWLSVGVFAAVMFLVGLTFAPYMASQQSLLLDLVGTDESLLSRANAAFQAATRLSMLLGPLLAGLLIATLTAPQVLLLDALSFAVSALLLYRRLPPATGTDSRGEQATGTGGHADRPSLRGGLRALRSDRLATRWTLGLALNEAAWQAMFAMIPLVALIRADASPVVAGALLGSYGGGTLLGTLAVGRLLRRVPPRTLAVSGRVALAAVFLALPLPLGVGAMACCLVLVGLLNGVSSAPVTAVRALRLPEHSRTEGLTVATGLTLAGGTAGWALAGFAAQSAGLGTTFLGLGILQAGAAGLFVSGALGTRAGTARDRGTPDPTTRTRSDDTIPVASAPNDAPTAGTPVEQEGTA
ncbi:MFS transporter [Streptomyces sp. NPDC012751]|uniref:MFS transporter n=1 Tax=Streptomyces sp. NPDC012751 TaxID=3364846 RepID=UPI003692277A